MAKVWHPGCGNVFGQRRVKAVQLFQLIGDYRRHTTAYMTLVAYIYMYKMPAHRHAASDTVHPKDTIKAPNFSSLWNLPNSDCGRKPLLSCFSHAPRALFTDTT